MSSEKIDILLDFDGTCVTHQFPGIGKDIGAIPVLKQLVKNGHRLILFTMRSSMKDVLSPFSGNIEDGGLSEALEWFKSNGIELYGVQSNPTQHEWTSSPKAFGHLIIDDIALGVPLTYKHYLSDKPFVDWIKVEKLLIGRGLI